MPRTVRLALSLATCCAALGQHGARAASAEYRLQLDVPVICEATVVVIGPVSGTLRELCNVVAPYTVALRHDAFDPGRTVSIEYSGRIVPLDPDGYTALATHDRGGLFRRDFRLTDAPEGFVRSLRSEARTTAD